MVLDLTFEVSPIDLRSTFALQRLGAGDPTTRLEDEGLAKRFAGEQGATRVAITRVAGGVRVAAEGPEAEAVLAHFALSLPPDDGYRDFAPASPRLRRLHRERPGLRLVAVPWRFDLAVGVVLQQRVEYRAACGDWRRLVEAHGLRGDDGGLALPPARRLARLVPPELERLGIDRQRASALIALAREEVRFGVLTAELDLAERERRLLAIPGIGPWTTALILGFGFAHRDAVPIGDLHLPRLAARALAGRPYGDDALLLELLAPYAGHRLRVCRLLLGG